MNRYSFILITALLLSCDSEIEEIQPDVKLSFYANKTYICEYECVDFNSSCNVNPDEWEWVFEGGFPDKSNVKNPKEIKYLQSGSFDVSLKITYQNQEYEYAVSDYIQVDPVNNSNFTFTALCAENDTIKAGHSTKLWAECTGNSLSYFWSATKGNIIGSGNEVTLSACICDKGISEVTCSVKNNYDQEVTRKINIVIQ